MFIAVQDLHRSRLPLKLVDVLELDLTVGALRRLAQLSSV